MRRLQLIGQIFGNGTVVEDLGTTTDRINKKEAKWKLQCDCGNTYEATSNELTSLRKKSCGCHAKNIRSRPKENNIGQKYGLLTVIDIDGSRNPSGKRYRKCICDCGQYKYMTLGQLKRKNWKPHCGCLNNKRGKNHPLWQGYGDISKKYWNRIKRNANNRGINFDISIEEAWQVWIDQGEVCNLSGQKLVFQMSKGSNFTASLDRIDNTIGYVTGNVQWIHKDINKCKTDLSEDKFIEICHMVSKKKS